MSERKDKNWLDNELQQAIGQTDLQLRCRDVETPSRRSLRGAAGQAKSEGRDSDQLAETLDPPAHRNSLPLQS